MVIPLNHIFITLLNKHLQSICSSTYCDRTLLLGIKTFYRCDLINGYLGLVQVYIHRFFGFLLVLLFLNIEKYN